MATAIFEATSYFCSISDGLPTEVRFHVRAANENDARAKSRVLMRERYAGEVNDATFTPGAAWPVPGVQSEGRLLPFAGHANRRWRRHAWPGGSVA